MIYLSKVAMFHSYLKLPGLDFREQSAAVPKFILWTTDTLHQRIPFDEMSIQISDSLCDEDLWYMFHQVWSKSKGCVNVIQSKAGRGGFGLREDDIL